MSQTCNTWQTRRISSSTPRVWSSRSTRSHHGSPTSDMTGVGALAWCCSCCCPAHPTLRWWGRTHCLAGQAGPRPPLARRHRAVTSLAEARSPRRAQTATPAAAVDTTAAAFEKRCCLRNGTTSAGHRFTGVRRQAQRRSCVMLLVLLPRAPHPEVVGAHTQSRGASAATVAAAVAAAAAAAAVSAAVVALLFGYLYI